MALTDQTRSAQTAQQISSNRSASDHQESQMTLSPKTITWHLPPEFAPQVAVLLAWPTAATDWQSMLPAAQANFAELAAAISLAAIPWILIPDPEMKDGISALVQDFLTRNDWQPQFKLEFSVCDYDDTWTRDYGPLCVFKASAQVGQKQLRLQDFIFNGWGGKFDATRDNSVTRQLWDAGEFERVYTSKLNQEKLFSVQIQEQPIILEGGSLETNGSLLLTTRACLQNINRNADLPIENLEQLLQKQLGVTDILWLDHGHLEGDDTDAHIDTLARFVNHNTIVFQGCQDANDSHYAGFAAMKQQLTQFAEHYELQLIELPWPEPQYENNRRLPATYANFLLVNNFLLLPTYDCAADADAISILEQQLLNYKVIPVNCQTLIRNNGSLHCSTMQLPHIWTDL